MTDEKRKVLTEFYDQLAEELDILYESLLKHGFGCVMAKEIMLNIVCDSRERIKSDRNDVLTEIRRRFLKKENGDES